MICSFLTDGNAHLAFLQQSLALPPLKQLCLIHPHPLHLIGEKAHVHLASLYPVQQLLTFDLRLLQHGQQCTLLRLL